MLRKSHFSMTFIFLWAASLTAATSNVIEKSKTRRPSTFQLWPLPLSSQFPATNSLRLGVFAWNNQPKKMSIFLNFLTIHLTSYKSRLYFEQLFCSIGRNASKGAKATIPTSFRPKGEISQKQQNIRVRNSSVVSHPSYVTHRSKLCPDSSKQTLPPLRNSSNHELNT